ncbi:hypothetical protein H072_742 [Dactylellina haptotyla CBS 200.50]|uniref:Uncharacterized protein n=1 Tax=Dactylellina haptotyla (strain CBS 200.50) TaxID=1284197 RepID=S8AQY9_DACHA|nr:hypothetical protein H072_742 [Dactylellina haptotyla CBS 200.50]
MASATSIPRLLLPRWPNGLIRLQARATLPITTPTTAVRFLRIPPKFPKPTQVVLEQPTKYNPPSHPTGPRPRESAHKPLPQKPHKEERTHYPGMMPAPGTIAHWILHSPKLHGLVAVSVLVSLALYVMYRNFMEHDQAAELAFWDWKHPIASAKSFVAAYRESDRINTARILEKRRQISEDMERKAHYRYVVEGRVGGPGEGLGSWGIRRTQRDEDFGWGIVIDGKTIDQYIGDKEKEKAEKREKEQEERSESAVEVKLDEQPLATAGAGAGEGKKTWW